MLIQLILGDPSGDGHSINETFLIESNLTSHQIEDAYNAFFDRYDLEKPCDDFEDSNASYLIPTLAKLNIFYSDLNMNYLSPDQFLQLAMRIVAFVDPTFDWQEADSQCVTLGGYGLFSI